MESFSLYALVAVSLLIYGVLHGILTVWVWVNHSHLLIPALLFISPVGFVICLLAVVPFIGWQAALTVAAAMAVGFAPVALIVWRTVFQNTGGLQ